jgi:hypothetical protein
MNPPWNPSPSELDDYARRHIAYEVRMLLAQIRHLETDFPNGPTNEIGDALIEAPIVHLRLFDDFFRKAAPHDDDVLALHWEPNWQPRSVLTEAERDETNQHAHLVARRGNIQAWQPRLPKMALRFCDIFDGFVVGLAQDRAKAFGESSARVAEFRAWRGTLSG